MNIIGAGRPIRYLLEGILYKFTQHSNDIKELKALANGKPLLVIGNGPSLNKTLLDDFKDIMSIGMNKINLLFPRVEWRPSIIISSNRHVIKQNQDFYRNTDIPVFLCWQSRWFIKARNRGKMKYFLALNRRKFSKDVSVGVSRGATITYNALEFAYYMNANPVILFGVDHSFANKGPGHKLIVSKSDDIDHFDPSYFGTGLKWNLPDLVESEQGYLRAKYAFESDKRIIYDATIGGKLNIFKKIDLDQARELCRI